MNVVVEISIREKVQIFLPQFYQTNTNQHNYCTHTYHGRLLTIISSFRSDNGNANLIVVYTFKSGSYISLLTTNKYFTPVIFIYNKSPLHM